MSGIMAVIAGEGLSVGAAVYDFSSGTGTILIPTGATSVDIESWGGGGGGGFGLIGPKPSFQDLPGGGGGSGGYCKSVVALSGDDGKSIGYSVGALGAGATTRAAIGGTGGDSTVYSGTFAVTSLQAGGGGGGQTGGDAGVGGAASGGNTTNTAGNNGALGPNGGGGAIAGDDGLNGGAGGAGGDADPTGAPGLDGEPGRVRFVFTV